MWIERDQRAVSSTADEVDHVDEELDAVDLHGEVVRSGKSADFRWSDLSREHELRRRAESLTQRRAHTRGNARGRVDAEVAERLPAVRKELNGRRERRITLSEIRLRVPGDRVGREVL